jgi:hypothetical protein
MAASGEPKPDCWLHHQSDFLLGNLPPGTAIGESFGVLLSCL